MKKIILFIAFLLLPIFTVKAESNSITNVTNIGNNKYKIESTLSTSSEQNNTSIVIVADKSAKSKITGLVDSIMTFSNNIKEIPNLKVGVIWYDYSIHEVTDGLVELNNPETLLKIKTELENMSGNASNVHGAVKTATKWLKEDTETADQNKYLIIITDLGGYIFSDENNLPVRRYTNGLYISNDDIRKKYTDDGIVDFDNITTQNIDDLIRKEILLNGVKADPVLLKEIGIKASEYAYDESLVESWDNLIPASRVYEPDYSSTTEKNAYLVGNQLLAIKDYNIITITRDYYPTIPQGKVTNKFADWVEENIGDRYKTEDNSILEIFQSIQKDVFVKMDEGKLTQVLNDEFEVDYDSINIRKNNETLKKTILDNGIGFGEKDTNDKYQYELIYNEESNQLELYINEEIDKNTNVELSYNVETADTVTKDINLFKSETIEYKDSYNKLNNNTTNQKFDSVIIKSNVKNPNTSIKKELLFVFVVYIMLTTSILYMLSKIKIKKYNN